jgi:hypothetical protein
MFAIGNELRQTLFFFIETLNGLACGPADLSSDLLFSLTSNPEAIPELFARIERQIFSQ